MALEIEAKIKVDSCDPLREHLRKLGAQQQYRTLEINRIFDTPDKQLFSRGCGLRIRTCHGEGRVPPPTLTYKGPQQTGPLKSREESETVVGDPRAAQSILESLGYLPVITFEKRREEWELGPVTVQLDEVPRLGFFVEIEGPDAPRVEDAQRELGLSGRPIIRESYIALLIDHARRNRLPSDRIRFEEH